MSPSRRLNMTNCCSSRHYELFHLVYTSILVYTFIHIRGHCRAFGINGIAFGKTISLKTFSELTLRLGAKLPRGWGNQTSYCSFAVRNNPAVNIDLSRVKSFFNQAKKISIKQCKCFLSYDVIPENFTNIFAYEMKCSSIEDLIKYIQLFSI